MAKPKNGSVSISTAEIFERIHQRTPIPVAMLSATFEEVLKEILTILSEGNNAVFNGFGTFSVRTTQRLHGITDHTLSEISTDTQSDEKHEPKYSVKFKASRSGTEQFRKMLKQSGYEGPGSS